MNFSPTNGTTHDSELMMASLSSQPDPARGTAARTGPDPSRGTSARRGPDPSRGTSTLREP